MWAITSWRLQHASRLLRLWLQCAWIALQGTLRGELVGSKLPQEIIVGQLRANGQVAWFTPDR